MHLLKMCVPLTVVFFSDRLGLEAKKEENLADWYSQVGLKYLYLLTNPTLSPKWIINITKTLFKEVVVSYKC